MNEQLKPEQEFELVKFKSQIQNLTEKELKNLLVQMFAQSLVRQNYYNALLKVEWGIG